MLRNVEVITDVETLISLFHSFLSDGVFRDFGSNFCTSQDNVHLQTRNFSENVKAL